MVITFVILFIEKVTRVVRNLFITLHVVVELLKNICLLSYSLQF